METTIRLPDTLQASPAMKPFVLFRDRIRPAIEARRADLDAMYAAVMGRPEVDPVLLLGVTELQALERVPDRQAAERCLFDLRWRLALGVPNDWQGFHPSTLTYFRGRLAEHGQAKVVLEAGLDAMRAAGYLKDRRAVRIDSTHVLAELAAMSRLECVRETLRLALAFLSAWDGAAAWEPWTSRYADRHAAELRNASVPRLQRTMAQAGADIRAVLARVAELGDGAAQADPIRLLRRVFAEQFEDAADQAPTQHPSAPAGAVHNPHDPEAQWCTKRSLGKAGWVGYKVQLCETAAEAPRAKREPTEAVITAVVTQPATTGDHGSLEPVLAAHGAAALPPPETVFADAGYVSAPALERAANQGYELCGPIGAPPHSAHRFGSDSFAVDIPQRRAICPAGQSSTECSCIHETGREGGSYYYFAWARADCAACPLATQCLSTKKRQAFRTLQVGDKHMLVQARRALCRTPAYQERMRRRSGIEGTNSEVKRRYGIRRCRYRGLAKTNVQMHFASAACNLQRWAARLCWLASRSP
jgi:IS5 family transposase